MRPANEHASVQSVQCGKTVALDARREQILAASAARAVHQLVYGGHRAQFFRRHSPWGRRAQVYWRQDELYGGHDWPGSENKLAPLSADDVNLSRLETLVFETRVISAFTCLFRVLRAPSLSRMDLQGWGDKYRVYGSVSGVIFPSVVAISVTRIEHLADENTVEASICCNRHR
ncbi:uncharacterized protein SCHCODRAFT_02495124 [Schizophyllum commune H4-8]|uniref:Expressed protein n=1 Tax=Schizophyllum commune (strain H4-8 / FGSC 9210) TaxID=578458 RepID=D8Q2Z0_SCHCM|nr:uncharacterized protein SCHCODRAFT_02495124 [Schizophyllum commune H4-8]KAI5894669.1 hypothetical protein SCHCODRAFT_02495124 [Schizophyllum commune H4-8]